MATKTCFLCQHGPAKKAKVCCNQLLCDGCLLSHAREGKCPRVQELAKLTPKQYREQNAPEASLRTQVVRALNMLSDVHVTAVDSGRSAGTGNLTEPGFADIVGRSRPDGRFIGVETKRSHSAGERQKGECACKSCAAQRAWGAELVDDGGVYVPNVRTVQQAVDGVRMGLARARAKSSEAA